jgi:hypothetical protein
MATNVKRILYNQARVSEGILDTAGVHRALETEITSIFFMYDRLTRL